MNYIDEIAAFLPTNKQEENDKRVILNYMKEFGNQILTRENEFAHVSSSSMILNENKDKVLMIYHNIYNSWSWTGGHADGEDDLYQVAYREALEETGLTELSPLSDKIIALDILPVWGHEKNGNFISSHLHLNTSYLFTADETKPLIIKPDENSDVKWIPIALLDTYVSEPDMLPVYKRILSKVASN